MEDLLKNQKRLFWSNLCYFIILTLFVILRIISSLGWLDFAGDYVDTIFSFITQILILFLVPLLIYIFAFKQKPANIFKAFGYRKISPKIILCSIGMGFIAFFIIIFVSTFFSIFIQLLGYQPYVSYASNSKMTFATFLLSMLTVAVMPALFEEFSHRGMLLSGYSKLSSIRAIVLSGLLFGLMHLNINQFFYAFVVGMLLATCALITKSIWPSVIIHFINNGLNTYLDYAQSNNLFGANFSEFISFSNVNIFARFLLYSLIICIVVYCCIWLLFKMFTITKKEQFYKFVKEFSGIKDPNQLVDTDNLQELLKIYLTQGKSIDFDLMTLNEQKSKNQDNLKQDNSDEIKINECCQSNIPQISMKQNNENLDNKGLSNSTQTQIQKVTFTQLINLMLPKSEYDNYKPTFKENFFLYCSIFLGAVVTIMTFIWGLF